jgi:hypothetical protein
VHPALPGLADSMPFLIVGVVLFVYGLWIAFTHSTAAIGRFSLELPMIGVGSVLLVGGTLGSFLEDEEHPDTVGKPRDRTFTRISSGEWNDLKAEVSALRAAQLQEGGAGTGRAFSESRSGVLGPSPSREQDASERDRGAREPWDEDWEPIPHARGTSPKPGERPEAVLLEADAVVRDLRPQTRSLRSTVESTKPSVLDEPRSPAVRLGTPSAATSTTAGSKDRDRPGQEVARGLAPLTSTNPPEGETVAHPRPLLSPAGGPAAPAASKVSAKGSPAGNGKCVTCGRAPGRDSQMYECASCGQTLCPKCRESSLRRWELPVCRDCGTFLEPLSSAREP